MCLPTTTAGSHDLFPGYLKTSFGLNLDNGFAVWSYQCFYLTSCCSRIALAPLLICGLNIVAVIGKFDLSRLLINNCAGDSCNPVMGVFQSSSNAINSSLSLLQEVCTFLSASPFD